MAKCSACGKFLSPTGAASCTSCTGVFHKGCVGLSDDALIAKDWSCPDCKKNLPRRGDNSSTPVKSQELQASQEQDSSATQSTTSVTLSSMQTASSVGESDLQNIRRELAEYMLELREFRKELQLSMANMGERMDTFERRLEAVERREPEISVASTAEVVELQQTVTQLRMDLNDRDQDLLSCDLDIGQLPEQRGENTVHVITVLAAKLGVTLVDQDVVFAERIGAMESGSDADSGAVSVRDRRVIVRLARRHLRDELLRAARVRRGLSSEDIVPDSPSRRVYINERLTRANRQLFNRVREEGRKRQWRYSWTKRGRIYVRQNDGKKVLAIRSDKDLERVFKDEIV